jgi:hypothetical protein
MKHSQTDSGGRVVGISGFALILAGRTDTCASGDDVARGDEPAVILRLARCGLTPRGLGGVRPDVEGGFWTAYRLPVVTVVSEPGDGG